MKIILNGKEREVADGVSVEGLIKTLGLNAAAVVVERNESVVERSGYASTHLAAADTIEIFQFVGGG